MKRNSFFFGFLGLTAILIWGAVFTVPDKNLKIIACDVGQGDAILAIYGSTQILFDGGPDNKVLDCLGRHLPFWEREIELVVLTHPQKDHYQGLIEVVRRFQVDNFLTSGLDAGSEAYQVLKKEVGSRGIRVLHSDRGLVLRFNLIYLEVVHPSKDYMGANSQESGTDPPGLFSTKVDPNNFSIVAILSLGKFDALLTGDLGPEVGSTLAKDSLLRSVEYLKVPHHGSKNGLTQDLLEKVS
ncbi:MBL fold metallo-hydrolase, partial [Candidatus Woesebacteria bacterium]|nr:MBL fold metallo-hydrolase [Candidatus Woesebacteria bacterium]